MTKNWTNREEDLMLGTFDSDHSVTIDTLAEQQGRTRAAIITRLIRLNRLYLNQTTGNYHRIDPTPYLRNYGR